MTRNTLMKLLAAIVLFISFTCCNRTRVVTMPYRNYDLSAERLMPLSYTDAKQSVRIWLSRSTSVDTVFTVSQNADSSYSAFLIELGQKHKTRGKPINYFSQKKMRPSGSFPNFFLKLDSMNLFAYEDQTIEEIVAHQPIYMYIVEYVKDKKYTKFSFQSDRSNSKTEQMKYKAMGDFIKREFR